MYMAAFILVLPAILNGALNISLMEKGRGRWFLFIAALAAGLIMSSFSVDFAMKDVVRILESRHLMLSLCTLLMVESILGIILTIMLSRCLLLGCKKPSSFAGFLSLAPPVMLPVALFVVQISVASLFNGIPYAPLLFTVTLIGTVAVFTVALVCSILLGNAGILLELKLMMYFLQAMMAMFVPVIVERNIPSGYSYGGYGPAFLVITLVMFLLALAGFAGTRFSKSR